MERKKLEIWADSFHEGEWCCDNLEKIACREGFVCEKRYDSGFLPIYTFKNEKIYIELEVYGSYNAWSDMPNAIDELIEWGKPDFIAYAPKEDKIIFAVEETSATMTGNQPMQRCERQYGSAIHRIPYWYLVSKFGMHLDGGMRTDSIWPSISALKLSIKYKTPNIVLHYSGEDSPEDYDSGNGLNLLFTSLYQILVSYAAGADNMSQLDIMKKQYEEMLEFINSHWRTMIDFIPSESMLTSENTARLLAVSALGQEIGQGLDGFMQWPVTAEVDDDKKNNWKKSEMLTYNRLSELFEEDIESNKCYILSNNAASGKPPTEQQVTEFLDRQKRAFEKGAKLDPPAYFDLELSSFKKTPKGNYNLTTSKNILYLYDRWSDLKNTVVKAYGRLEGKFDDLEADMPAMVYISNSLAPRRIFGDPFIGQLTAYSIIFGKIDKRKRLVLAYYPHQSYTYYKESGGKGKKIISELVDYAIFAGGVMINIAKEEIC